MNIEEISINLDLPAKERWQFLSDYAEEVTELLACYLKDFEGADFLLEGIDLYKGLLNKEYLDEIDCIASMVPYTGNQVLLANLYYDVLKLYLGCTAFAVHTGATIFHARNLDWWTDNNLLSKHSRIFNFQRKGKTVFKSVGWLGFIGVLSGMKPKSFTVTLNAVSSKDAPEFAQPISFFLRDVLTQANSFEEAKALLQNTAITSDCLLLLSGIKADEMVVIERTPKRNAIRTTTTNYITVTNDYKLLENGTVAESELQNTSCDRFDRTEMLLNKDTLTSTTDCFSILQDTTVMMNITVQQMVFETISGKIDLIKVT